MTEEIKRKMDDHIKEILGKPSITNEDYALLKEKMFEIRSNSKSQTNWMWPYLLAMTFFGFGGAQDGV